MLSDSDCNFQTNENNHPETSDFIRRIDYFHYILEEWLTDSSINVACGRWPDGAIAEMPVHGKATLLPEIYEECFSGVRELRLGDCGHHMHIDLGRVHTIQYTVSPSVCFDFRPSFEIRFLTLGPGGSHSAHWVFSIMISQPYGNSGLNLDAVERFFSRAWNHYRQYPAWVDIHLDKRVLKDPSSDCIFGVLQKTLHQPFENWEGAFKFLGKSRATHSEKLTADPVILPLMKDALALKESSLVIYRDRLLVEFQTEKISGLYRYIEDGHVSWQIGHLNEHHCHLALHAVSSVLFSAEPTSCQQGRLNYTIWFIVDGDCGNPWQRNGYFSVVLNRPYQGDQLRQEIIQPMMKLYNKYSQFPWVKANHAFIESLDRIEAAASKQPCIP